MYQAIHSLIVSDGKGGAKELLPGSGPHKFDAAEAERLLRIGAIKAIEGNGEQAAEKPSGKKPKAAKAAEKAVKDEADADADADADAPEFG